MADAGSALAGQSWQNEGWPLIQQFCLDCHNEDTQEAELDLSGFHALSAVAGDQRAGGGSMQRVLEMVRFGAMPPEDAEQPTPEERKALVASLDQTIFAVSCDLRPRPGRVTARRLNRAEYDNTIRDLFGVDLNVSDAFPSDEVGAGFDNNGDVLSLSPMLIEKYLDAAEEISTKVLIDPDTLPKIDAEKGSDQLLIHGDSRAGSFYGRFMAPDAFAWADFEIPVAGEYRVRVRAGNSRRDQDATVFAAYDGKGVLRGKDDLTYYGGGGSAQRFEFRMTFEPGRQRIYVEPVTDAEIELKVGETTLEKFTNLDPEIERAAVERQKKRLKPDRRMDRDDFPFMVREIEIEGPTKRRDDPFPPSQHQILARYAKFRDDKWHDVMPAAMECLRPLMRRAFRQPVTDDEVRPYAELVSDATERGESYYRGLQIAISAVLVSPRFLFRVETPPEGWERDEDGNVRLTPHQLASRLSYFLWSSSPDEVLMSVANKDKLSGEQLRHQVRRMLKDDKASSLAEQFAAQWLGLRDLQQHEADTDRFASFTPTLRSAMSRETELLFLHVVQEDLPIADLLATDFTFVNEELARHYGIDGVKGNEFQKVSLKGTPRRGVLSHASVLTLTSNPGRTSPVRRGKWILENVLGTPPPDPPAGVPELEETKTADANATLREQLELHRADPACAACHRVMDQLGFGLERFDAIGRYRGPSDGQEIDASGELPGGRVFDGAAELSGVLLKSESEAFARTVVHRLMTFALGRELTPTDRCTVDEIVAETAKNNHRFGDLVWAVVNSRPFQYYELDVSEVVDVN